MLTMLPLILAAFSSAATAEAWPKGASFAGPSAFCGSAFRTELRAGEQAHVRDGRLDFLIYFFENGPVDYSIYEGMHPQHWDRPQVLDAGIRLPVTRMWKNNHASYLIKTTSAPALYAHVMARSFDGTAKDFALLRTIKFGDAKKIGCAAPTYKLPR